MSTSDPDADHSDPQVRSSFERAWRRVLLTLPDRNAFTRIYLQQGECGGISLNKAGIDEGERLELEIVFIKELMTFHVRGTVASVDSQSGRCTVLFEPFDRRARDVILGFARGENDHSVTRRARRFPIELPVSYTEDEVFHQGRTIDLNVSGCHIVGDRVPRQGTLLAIRLPSADGASSLTVNAEVVWISADSPPRFGVMFLAAEGEKRQQLESLVRSAVTSSARD